MTKKEYQVIDYEIEQAQIHLATAIDLLDDLKLFPLTYDFSDAADTIRWKREDLAHYIK